MPWVRFSKDFEWWPSAQVTISYKAGTVKNVTRRCAAEAKVKGAATASTRPAGEVKQMRSVDGD